MTRTRESLTSVKTRLAREQQTRTERRVEALLHPKEKGQDVEIFDDSDEENRLSGRRVRAKRDQATQRYICSSSFCCGAFVSVFVGIVLVLCLILSQTNGTKQRMAE